MTSIKFTERSISSLFPSIRELIKIIYAISVSLSHRKVFHKLDRTNIAGELQSMASSEKRNFQKKSTGLT